MTVINFITNKGDRAHLVTDEAEVMITKLIDLGCGCFTIEGGKW